MKPIFLVFIILLFAGVSCNNKSSQDNTDETATEDNSAGNESSTDNDLSKDAEFMKEVAESNRAEIELAQLALQRSENSEVRDVAQMLESDHKKALQELDAIAQDDGIQIPAEEVNDASQRKIENLKEKEDSKEFNEEWCSELVDRHEKTIEKFEDKMEKTDNPELRSWINQTLPTLRAHLDRVKSCQQQLKSS
jgi:putative membrane protein